MGKDLVEQRGNIPAMFSAFGVDRVTTKDQFTINYRDGLLEVQIKRPSGQSITVTKHVKGDGFRQLTTFDPDQMSKKDRNHLIRQMHEKGKSQAEIARTFGLSQARISGIVNRN